MHYTVNQLAKISNVTVRTLRFYDGIGLLKPAYVASNGYRIYEEKQLLQLQQILFFRELGFELKHIQEIVGQDDFDQLEALRKHKKVLRSNISRMNTLMKTVDTTIQHLEGKQAMSGNEMFKGFAHTQEVMKAYQTRAMNAWKEHVGTDIEVTVPTEPLPPLSVEEERDYQKHRTAALAALEHMPEEMRTASLRGTVPGTPEFEAVLRKHYEAKRSYTRTMELFAEMAGVFSQNHAAGSAEMQELVKQHYELYKASAPTREDYIGTSKFYLDPVSEHTFEKYPKGLASFLAQAMVIFAEKNLS